MITIKDAKNRAILDAIRMNYEELSKTKEWESHNKTQRAAMMELACGTCRQSLMPYLAELGIEL